MTFDDRPDGAERRVDLASALLGLSVEMLEVFVSLAQSMRNKEGTAEYFWVALGLVFHDALLRARGDDAPVTDGADHFEQLERELPKVDRGALLAITRNFAKQGLRYKDEPLGDVYAALFQFVDDEMQRRG